MYSYKYYRHGVLYASEIVYDNLQKALRRVHDDVEWNEASPYEIQDLSTGEIIGYREIMELLHENFS